MQAIYLALDLMLINDNLNTFYRLAYGMMNERKCKLSILCTHHSTSATFVQGTKRCPLHLQCLNGCIWTRTHGPRNAKKERKKTMRKCMQVP